MYAVFRTGGKQYRAAPGETLRVEALAATPGSEVLFDEVLYLGGETPRVGTPVVSGARVRATVLAHGLGPKVRIFKLRRRKNSRTTRGHRQRYSEVRIDEIVAPQE